MNRKYLYDILVSAQDNAQLLEESADLVCIQLKGQDFENVFNKNGDFQQLICKNQIQRDVHCAKNIWVTIRYLMFSYPRHFPSFLVVG